MHEQRRTLLKFLWLFRNTFNISPRNNIKVCSSIYGTHTEDRSSYIDKSKSLVVNRWQFAFYTWKVTFLWPFFKIIVVGQEKFKIIQKKKQYEDEVKVNSRGVEILNTMEISESSLQDSGMYICFVKNPSGFKFKSAYLTVIPSK